jgi:hypothetical protein
MHPLTGSRLRANDERFRLDADAGVVSLPARPECPSVVPRRAQGVVVGACGLSVFFARPPVLSDRDDRSGAAREDGGVAATCIVGAVHCPAGHRDAMSREGAVTVPICSSSGIWPRRSGRIRLSTSRFSGPSIRRKGICTVRVFCLRHSVEKSGTGQSSPPTSAGAPPSRKSGAMAA